MASVTGSIKSIPVQIAFPLIILVLVVVVAWWKKRPKPITIYCPPPTKWTGTACVDPNPNGTFPNAIGANGLPGVNGQG